MSDVAAERFGPYRVEELLGRGGMGEVHRAYDTTHGRHVALKRLPPGVGAEFVARFRREAKLVARLRAPHIVPINAHGEIDGRLYLDMRLIDGPDLKRVLAGGPLPPARAVAVLTQVAAALDAAHADGVLHRDVKPANVLLDADGVAYLADFGIARSLAPDVTLLTDTGDYVGTLDYMAPERLMHGELDVASDVYALACVLFQCLTGRVPFPAQDAVGKLAAQLNDPPPAPSLFDRAIPPAMDLVVRTGMDKDPRRRYPSAGELMAAAAAVIAQATADAPTATVLDPAAGDPARSHFVRLLVTHARARETTAPTVVAPDQCPYPGLRSFGVRDSGWFFGRERAVADLLARVSRQRADSGPLIVVGASGAGKSSLLHAGLLAAHVGAGAPLLAMTPGEHPMTTLAARLAALTRSDPHRLSAELRHRPAVFGELCRAVGGENGPLVVAVDQAEELFTQCADPAERAAFATALAAAWPARAVLAVRADFVEHCIGLPALKPALEAPYVLAPLGADELARVITGPAEAAGLVLEPGLVDRLVTDVGADRGPGALPRLAHALRETWHHRAGNRLTLTGYQRTGGVDRAVALTADGMYERLAEPDRHALRAALLRMVTLLDGGGIARRRAHRAEVSPLVLESLVAARLVTVDHDFVQLSHDALLTAWPRLREWVEEDRQGLLVRQRLAEAAAGWRAGGEDRGDLYRGARLAAALDWAAGRTDLTRDEHAFLQASERDRRRTTRRLRSLAASLACLLVAALVATALVVVARNDTERERQAARSRQLAAESLAQAEVDPIGAARKALEAWRTRQTTEARGALLSTPLLTYPAGFDSGVDQAYSVDVNQDGSLVAVGSADGRVVLWDAEERAPLDVEITGAGSVVGVRFSPDGTLLAVSSLASDATEESGVRIWEVPSGKLVRRLFDGNTAIGAIAWRPDGEAVAASSVRADGTAAVAEWDPWTGNLVRWVAGDALDTSALAYSRSADRLAVGHLDGRLDLWDPETATLVSRRTEHGDNAAAGSTMAPVQVTFSADLLASSSVSDNLIRLWDPRTGAPVRQIADVTRHVSDPAQGPTSLVFAPDGAELYSNSDVNSISRWDPLGAVYLGSLAHGPRAGAVTDRTVLAVALSGDGRTKVAATSDGFVLRWRTNSDWYGDPHASIVALAFAPDSGSVTAGDSDGGLHTWDTRTGARRAATAGGGAVAVRYTPDGTRVTGSADAVFTAAAPRARPRTVTFEDRRFHGQLAVSPDGALVAAAHEAAWEDPGEPMDHRIHVWDTATMTERAVLELGEERPLALVFSPDGDRLLALTGSGATSLMSWRVPDFTGRERVSLGPDSLLTMAVTPDGRTLLTAGTSGTIQVRDAATGRLREEFGEHSAAVRQIALSPDGGTVASATTDDATVRLWRLDMPGRPLLAELTGHRSALNDLVFAPDGRRLASGGTDTDVAVWRLDPADAARQVCENLEGAGAGNLDGLGC